MTVFIILAIYAFIGYATRLILAYRFDMKDDIYNTGIDYVGGLLWPVAILFAIIFYSFDGIAYVASRKPIRRVHAFFVQHIGGKRIDV